MMKVTTNVIIKIALLAIVFFLALTGMPLSTILFLLIFGAFLFNKEIFASFGEIIGRIIYSYKRALKNKAEE